MAVVWRAARGLAQPAGGPGLTAALLPPPHRPAWRSARQYFLFDRHALPLQVVGLVEELCSQASLHHFSWRVAQQPALRPLWPVYHIASEFASLMEQVGWGRGEAHCGEGEMSASQPADRLLYGSFGDCRSSDRLTACWLAQIDVMDGMGLAHQDIKARRLSMCLAGAADV